MSHMLLFDSVLRKLTLQLCLLYSLRSDLFKVAGQEFHVFTPGGVGPWCFVHKNASDATTGGGNKRKSLPCRLNWLFHIFAWC